MISSPPAVLLGLLLSACAVPPAAEAGWQLVWSDEFNRDGAPDPTKWDYADGRVRDDTLQFYTRDRAANARVEGGHLILEARREHFAGATFTSAGLHTQGKASWTHARVEVRARLPRGRCLRPAIRMLSDHLDEVHGPTCGQIDVMECVGFEPGVVYANVYSGGFNPVHGNGHRTKIPLADASETFHVYAVEWDRERMVFSIDGKSTFTVANDHTGVQSWPFGAPFWLLCDVAVGDGQPDIDESVFPQRLVIDWVRVSERR